MKSALALMLACLSLSVTAQLKDTTRGIHFIKGLSWQQLIYKARQENKFIFVDVYATWCVPCKTMDKAIYPDDSVGNILNKDFISVKMQMDKTPHDDAETIASYATAKWIEEQFKPEGFPCFLFFNPDGQLAHRDLGVKDKTKFLSMAAMALQNPIGNYQKNMDSFHKGKLAFEKIPALMETARKQKASNEIIEDLASTYKKKYLDKLSSEDAFTKDNLYFLGKNPSIIDTQDRYFKFFYKKGNKADSILNMPNVSSRIVLWVIRNEEIDRKIYRNGKPLSVSPKWEKMQQSIQGKYSGIDAEGMILDAQILYYEVTKNWNEHLQYFIKKIDKYGISSLGIAAANTIASSFVHADDKRLLLKAIGWTESLLLKNLVSDNWEQMVKRNREEAVVFWNNDFSNYAALLYKAGRNEEAIRWIEWHIKLINIEIEKEKGMVEMSQSNKDFTIRYRDNKIEILNRMKKGEEINDTWNITWFN